MKLLDVKNSVLKKNVHYLTSDYHTRNGSRSTHNGMDMIGKNKSTDYIIAVDNGEVTNVNYSSSAGYYVNIRHSNNFVSKYMHMKKNSIVVKKGDLINKGDVIGYMGNTGNSTGAHLHFAVYSDKSVPQDPLPYLQNVLNFNTYLFSNFVKDIQASLNAKVDGIVGSETFNKTITISAKTNRKHKCVKYIQKYLYSIGYTEIGNADGIAGPKFTKAIKHFQKDNGCIKDGIITKRNKTWKKLLKLI